jgi:hypothetical protein
MFIRAQFSAQAFQDMLKFRVVSGWRPCSKLYYEIPLLWYSAITKLRFVGITQVSLGAAVPAPYPNVIGPPVTVFQQKKTVLRVEYEIAAGYAIFPTYVVHNVTAQATADLAIDLRLGEWQRHAVPRGRVFDSHLHDCISSAERSTVDATGIRRSWDGRI